jgi:hypothetical protein
VTTRHICFRLTFQKDIETLRGILPNVRRHLSFKNYNHVDFNYGKDARPMLYENILSQMNAE